MSSIDIQTLIHYKVLLAHPCASKIKELISWIWADEEEYTSDILLKNIKEYNSIICSKCFKYDSHYYKCTKCDKPFCQNCDRTMTSVCYNCVDKCHVCNTIDDYNAFYECYFCNKKFCINNDECKMMRMFINNKQYLVCKKECIPFSFKRKQVIISLDRKFRRKNLLMKIHDYNMKLRADSTLCSKYINGELDRTFTPEKVAQKMCEMKYLYDFCDMRNCMYGISWEEVDEWEKNNYGKESKMGARFEIAKNSILHNIKEYPIMWPWTNRVLQKHKLMMQKVYDELSYVPEKLGYPGGINYHKIAATYKKLKKKKVE